MSFSTQTILLLRMEESENAFSTGILRSSQTVLRQRFPRPNCKLFIPRWSLPPPLQAQANLLLSFHCCFYLPVQIFSSLGNTVHSCLHHNPFPSRQTCCLGTEMSNFSASPKPHSQNGGKQEFLKSILSQRSCDWSSTCSVMGLPLGEEQNHGNKHGSRKRTEPTKTQASSFKTPFKGYK